MGRLKEKVRDKTRDRICADLQGLGVKAHMATRGQLEENMGSTFLELKESLGIIYISDSPIRWIDVRRSIAVSKDDFRQLSCYIVCGVPDFRLNPKVKLQIESDHFKRFLLWRKEKVALRWRGKDSGLGIIRRLDSDTSINQTIMMSDFELRIRSISDHKCWIISTEFNDILSRELWDCYQAIAQHLLADWSTNT
jgi:hypothetical protein